jgi:glycosyltransferase involved in cell wall biosynthesis
VNDQEQNPPLGAAPRARVCHVSADFPDAIVPAKTRAIETLLSLTKDRFDHQVISINRVGPSGLGGVLPIGSATRPHVTPFAWGECLTYAAPGRGLFHRSHLVRLADAIAERIAGGPRPDLLVGHKLTVEGIVVEAVARRISVPYALTVQGDTDTKILSARPDLTPAFRSIFREAASVTLFAPWTLGVLEQRLGPRSGPTVLIPCPTELDTPIPPRAGGTGLLSVFHLQSHARKNLAGMAEALRILDRRGSPQALTICGGGSAADIAAARRAAGTAPGLTFAGPLTREAVPARMNAAAAFVLPSLRESFGLVFVEALFAGLPIIYPQGMGVSGWFDDCPFAIPVPPRDRQALADAMEHAVRAEPQLKAALARWQGSGAAERFSRSAIAQAYGDALAGALAGEAVR